MITPELDLPAPAAPADIHVSIGGDDANEGSAARPFRTISAAARAAQPGDVVTVHAGTYRERVDPPRGGTSDIRRIVYQAARGESVEIKGSEVVKGWEKTENGVWSVSLPNSFFGDFNPYTDRIHGDWFTAKGRRHHTGAVYLDGVWLSEAASIEEVRKSTEPLLLWFAEVDAVTTTILGAFRQCRPERAGGRDQCPPHGFLSGKNRRELSHGARLYHAACRNPLGAADSGTGRPHRHELEQGLDHRE
jgi:alpha-N-arabinofuranosidase